MSTFRRIDSLLDGKTSHQLAREVAGRERERAEKEQRAGGQPPVRPQARPRPLIARMRGSATVRGVLTAVAVGLGLGLVVVVLKALAFTH